MTNIQNFSGFSQEVISFYNELALNNDRDWFNAHKSVYTEKVLEPAQGFVLAMGERLRMLSPNIIADPRTNGSGSIFRIYKDTRFSKDKTPYKTFLGDLFLGREPQKNGKSRALLPTNSNQTHAFCRHA